MIRTLVKNISGIIFLAVPVSLLIRITGQRIILPFYHAVNNEPLPHLKYLYSIRTVKQFSSDLDFLLKHYHPVSFSDLYELIKSERKTEKPIMALSFDDGLKEVYEIAVPILIKKGVPAAIFVNTAFAGNRALFFKYKASLILDRLENLGHPSSLYEIINSRMGTAIKRRSQMFSKILNIDYQQQAMFDSIAELLEIDFDSYLKIRKPYMTTEQLKDLRSKGFEIGSHSIDHPFYSGLKQDEQLMQTSDSMKWIMENFNPRYRLFSFPFIDDGVSSGFFDAIYSNAQKIVDMSFGSSGLKKEKYPFHLQRIPMEKSKLGACVYIKGEYLYYIMKSFAGRNVAWRSDEGVGE
jgi:peptidoglycan/xylan/chitin deacetylase (PgdA/CDA1 family)